MGGMISDISRTKAVYGVKIPPFDLSNGAIMVGCTALVGEISLFEVTYMGGTIRGVLRYLF